MVSPALPIIPRDGTSWPDYWLRLLTIPLSTAFFAGSTRFYIRGVDYQPGGSSGTSDPLADTSTCQRDIDEFKKLGVNTVRVYMVDNSANHDTCMNALADAGIYLILDVNNPKYSINRANPGASYNDVYLQSVFATIDAFVKYTNTLAFFSGNEVVNDQTNTTLAAPYVKATTRDMRQYIRERGYRNVPVGYSAADVAQNRQQLADYFNCGSDDERSDFFAFNDYSWCDTNFQQSGWDQKVKNFTGYGLPLFLSEYGCIKNGRTFGEVEALMNSEMTGVYSGGIVYQYAEEADNPGYGLVSIQGSSVSEMSDFTAYSTALSANPTPSGDGGFTSTTNTQACPSVDSDWLVSNTLLPAIPTGATKYMTAGAGTGPGLDGDGSQNAGGTSTGDASPGSGSATTTAKASGTGKSAASRPAALDKYGFMVTGVVFCATLVGTMLL